MPTKKIIVDNVEYAPVGEEKPQITKGLKYVVIRTYSAGVHAGFLKSRKGKEVELVDARRLWRWAGAFTLSELSKDGSTKMGECKFATTLDSIILTEAIEIIFCTKKAFDSITSIPDYVAE